MGRTHPLPDPPSRKPPVTPAETPASPGPVEPPGSRTQGLSRLPRDELLALAERDLPPSTTWPRTSRSGERVLPVRPGGRAAGSEAGRATCCATGGIVRCGWNGCRTASGVDSLTNAGADVLRMSRRRAHARCPATRPSSPHARRALQDHLRLPAHGRGFCCAASPPAHGPTSSTSRRCGRYRRSGTW